MEKRNVTQKLSLAILFLLVGAAAYAQVNGIYVRSVPVPITWGDHVTGDFSFRKQWDYASPVSRNKYQQLVCDGMCPEGVEAMMDSKGRIVRDSVAAYYRMVDTTHIYHSIFCKSWSHDEGMVNDILVERRKDTIACHTMCSGGIYSSLYLYIIKDRCFAAESYQSPGAGAGEDVFFCKGGEITIDKTHWAKGILKAVFSFNFTDSLHPSTPRHWKGKIYQQIK